jgi:hypothetical protein
MPWTFKQFRYLMSKASPLTEQQKNKDKAEAHADPAMIHMKKGSSRMATAFRKARHG